MLKRFVAMAGVFTVVGLAGLVVAAEPSMSIKQAMTKIAKGKNSAVPALKTALAAPTPDWKVIQANTKTVATCTAAIVDLKPSKGSQENYTKLATALAANAKALNESAEKEDLAGAKAAYSKIGGSCMTCHNAHRGR